MRRIKQSTFDHIACRLGQKHHIVLQPSLVAIAEFIFHTAGTYTRQEQAEMCGVSIGTIYFLINQYTDGERPRPICQELRVFTWQPHGTKTLLEWVIWSGLPRLTTQCLKMRLLRGWGLELALTKAVQERGRKT